MLLFRRARVPIFKPFLQLSLLANLQRSEFGPGLRQLSSKVRVDAQNRGGFDAIGKQVAENLLVHGGPGAHSGSERMLVLG